MKCIDTLYVPNTELNNLVLGFYLICTVTSWSSYKYHLQYSGGMTDISLYRQD